MGNILEAIPHANLRLIRSMSNLLVWVHIATKNMIHSDQINKENQRDKNFTFGFQSIHSLSTYDNLKKQAHKLSQTSNKCRIIKREAIVNYDKKKEV